MKNHAFTLIELLVVVLIIGILSAIALPQYRIAVLKTRTARIIPVVRSLGNAQEVYYIANGEYADSFDKLDISLPGNASAGGAACNAYIPSSYYDCHGIDDWAISIGKDSNGIFAIESAYGDGQLKIIYYLQHKFGDNYKGEMICLAFAETSTTGKHICATLGRPTDNSRYFIL